MVSHYSSWPTSYSTLFSLLNCDLDMINDWMLIINNEQFEFKTQNLLSWPVWIHLNYFTELCYCAWFIIMAKISFIVLSGIIENKLWFFVSQMDFFEHKVSKIVFKNSKFSKLFGPREHTGYRAKSSKNDRSTS